MRRRNVRNINERMQNTSDLIVSNPLEFPGKWQSLFPNSNPIYLEIGMGKGDFIIEHAKTYPDINFIGLEKYPSVLIQAYEKAKDLNLPNLKLVVFDATELLKLFSEGEISKIFLNFSDPWPKTRHAKRRLTSPSFLKEYETILKEEGEIEFKTDNQGLFEYSLVVMNNYGLKFLDLAFDLHHEKEEYIIKTEYEKKFMEKNHPIYYLRVKYDGRRN